MSTYLELLLESVDLLELGLALLVLLLFLLHLVLGPRHAQQRLDARVQLPPQPVLQTKPLADVTLNDAERHPRNNTPVTSARDAQCRLSLT